MTAAARRTQKKEGNLSARLSSFFVLSYRIRRAAP